ncbi:MAG: hypothetical protein WC569_02790 [Candidatus Omnitrophota bacterium]
MKKLLLLAACFIVAGRCGFAEEEESCVFDFGTEISNIKYEEPGVMKEEGVMYGIAASYTYRNAYMLRADGRYASGQVDYKNSGTLNDIDDYILELRGLVGYDLSKNKTKTFTPYAGFGYRYLLDDQGGMTTSTGAKGYDRESNYFYSPIGIETTNSFNNGWTMGATLEYDYFWKGKQKSYLSDARLYDPITGYYTYNDIENSQDSGYGVRGSMKLEKKGKKLDFGVEPYIRYWKIKQSDVTADSVISEDGLWLITSAFVEPKNESTEVGVRFTLRFDIPQVSERIDSRMEPADTKNGVGASNTLETFREKGYITEEEYETSKESIGEQ